MTDRDHPTRRAIARWWESNRHTVAGIALSALAVGVAAAAIIDGANKPLNTVQTVLFLGVAALLQAGAGLLFNRSGRADPALARSAVRRLLILTARTRKARGLAEKHSEAGTPAETKNAMGVLSVELSWLEEGFASAAQDWAEFHPDAIRKLDEEDQK